jgi:dihydroflavonol-4-reductase
VAKGLVLVTGASGYIAGFTIKALIADGWSVRGTLRDPGKAPKIRETLQAPALDLVVADLGADAGWAEAVTGVDHVLHMASPIPDRAPKNDDELIIPARDGALRVLRAACDAGVRRVVMTSSVAAICYGRDINPPRFTEADWTNPDHPDSYAYVRSKTIAERAARDFMTAQGGDTEFCTINPGAVLGPVLGSGFSASLEVVRKLLGGELPGCPRLGFPLVDVRDVADIHLHAMTAPAMHGERFIAAGPFLWLREIAEILKFRLGAEAKKVPTRTLPDWMIRASALFDPTVRMIISELGRERHCDASHARATLGWTARPVEETIVDCARSLLDAKLVKGQANYR